MSFVNSLLSQFKRGPARPNYFDVRLDIPDKTGSTTVLDLQVSSENVQKRGLVYGFTTPTKEFEVKEFSYYGTQRKIPIRRKFGSFSITFLPDDYYVIASWIERWTDTIVNPFSNFTSDYSGVISKGTVTVETKSQNSSGYGARWIFAEAYPAQILPITFNREERNSLARYEVIFNFFDYLYQANDNSPEKYITGIGL